MTTEEIEQRALAIVKAFTPEGVYPVTVFQRVAEILFETPVDCPWPVRECEPGYRWVRPGEELLATDQVGTKDDWMVLVQCGGGGVVQAINAKKACPYGYYRRKVTTKSDTGDIAALLDCQPEHASAVVSDMKRVLDELMAMQGCASALNLPVSVQGLKDDRDAWAETAAEKQTQITKLNQQVKDVAFEWSRAIERADGYWKLLGDARTVLGIKHERDLSLDTSSDEKFVHVEYDRNLDGVGFEQSDVRVSEITALNFTSKGNASIRLGVSTFWITPESAERVKTALGLVKP